MYDQKSRCICSGFFVYSVHILIREEKERRMKYRMKHAPMGVEPAMPH